MFAPNVLRGIALVFGVLAGSPAQADSAEPPERETLVAAAVSLRIPLIAIARAYEAERPGERVVTTFGSSSLMATQVRAGAPIDVIVVANPTILDDLAATGHIDPNSRFALAGNRLVIVVAQAMELELSGAEDLLRPEFAKLALPEPAVPLGSYAREWLRRHDLLAPLRSRIVPTPHARAALAAVDAGNADVAIVYATDARLAHSALTQWKIPATEQPDIAYEVALVSEARQPEPARNFSAYLRNDQSRATLREAGFVAR